MSRSTDLDDKFSFQGSELMHFTVKKAVNNDSTICFPFGRETCFPTLQNEDILETLWL